MNQKENSLIWIGTLVNTHGVKGEVRILSETDTPNETFAVGKTIEYVNNDNKGQFVIKTMRLHKQFILLTFEGINNINDIEYLKGSKIYCERAELDEGEYYLRDLIGCSINDQGKVIGKIIDIVDQGPYENLIVELENNKKTNIPMVDEFEVEYDGKQVTVKLPEGYLG